MLRSPVRTSALFLPAIRLTGSLDPAGIPEAICWNLMASLSNLPLPGTRIGKNGACLQATIPRTREGFPVRSMRAVCTVMPGESVMTREQLIESGFMRPGSVVNGATDQAQCMLIDTRLAISDRIQQNRHCAQPPVSWMRALSINGI